MASIQGAGKMVTFNFCPDCPTAEVVRLSVWDERFWAHLFVLALPLLVLAGIVAAIHGVGTRRGGGGRQ
jgi:hypothetical protein